MDLHGPAAAAFAFMAALGGSTMALLGALHPLWRLNMLTMTILTVMTMVAIAVSLPESPIWLMRKGREVEAEAAMRRIRGEADFKDESKKLKAVYEANRKLAKSKANLGKTWSVPVVEIVDDAVKRRRGLPKPPFSFLFLSVLFAFVGWSGFSYLALNGPEVFEVELVAQMMRGPLCLKCRHSRTRLGTWESTSTT